MQKQPQTVHKEPCNDRPRGIYSIYTNGDQNMAAVTENLLVKFRSRDTQFGVTRETVKALAKEFDVNETQVIHMALSKFAREVLPAYAPDDGPLTAKQIRALRKDAAPHLPKGKILSREALFA
jgi:hypothetical protein